MLRRGLTDVRQQIYTENGLTQKITVKPAFFQIRFEMTNKVYKVIRTFKTIFDVLSDLGGIFEMIILIFTTLMSFYGNTNLKVIMLNNLIHHKKPG